MPYKMLVTPDKVDAVRSWFKERGGCLLWHNLELGASRSDQMTPATHADGTPATPPHWAYGQPEPIQPAEIGVRTETKVELPPEWFPPCDACKQTGRRPVEEIALTWQCSIDDAKARLRKDNRDWDVRDSDNTLKCYYCDGTGHIERRIKVAPRRGVFGTYHLTRTGVRKGAEAAAKLGEDVKYDFEHLGYGQAQLVFYREKIEPFMLDDGRF